VFWWIGIDLYASCFFCCSPMIEITRGREVAEVVRLGGDCGTCGGGEGKKLAGTNHVHGASHQHHLKVSTCEY